MDKAVVFNLFINSVVSLVFVFLNGWFLRQGFEESFVAIALLYGIVITGGNALFVSWCCRKTK